MWVPLWRDGIKLIEKQDTGFRGTRTLEKVSHLLSAMKLDNDTQVKTAYRFFTSADVLI